MGRLQRDRPAPPAKPCQLGILDPSSTALQLRPCFVSSCYTLAIPALRPAALQFGEHGRVRVQAAAAAAAAPRPRAVADAVADAVTVAAARGVEHGPHVRNHPPQLEVLVGQVRDLDLRRRSDRRDRVTAVYGGTTLQLVYLLRRVHTASSTRARTITPPPAIPGSGCLMKLRPGDPHPCCDSSPSLAHPLPFLVAPQPNASTTPMSTPRRAMPATKSHASQVRRSRPTP